MQHSTNEPESPEPGSHFDVIVVGGGPAGLSGALLLSRACRSVLVIDDELPRNARARSVNNYLGVEAAAPQELRSRGREQIALYGVRFLHDRAETAKCVSSDAEPTLFELETSCGFSFHARKLLIATGVRDELPRIPGLSDCYGTSVHHCPYCDGWEHRGQQLLALGNTIDSGLGLAKLLRGWSERVTLLANGLPLMAADRAVCRECAITCCAEPVAALIHDNGRLNEVTLAGGRVIAADALFFASASAAGSPLPVEVGCRPKNKGQFDTGRKQATEVPGVFLAGDADGDVQFAIVAAGEGAIAGTAINEQLNHEDLGRRQSSPEE